MIDTSLYLPTDRRCSIISSCPPSNGGAGASGRFPHHFDDTMTPSDFGAFRDSHVRAVQPLAKEVNLAYWRAAISGKPEDFERSADLQVRLQRVYANRKDFDTVRRWREDGSVADPLEHRQLDLLFHTYLRNQIDPALNERITKLGSSIDNQFNVYRARIDGRTATSNDILRILKESNDSDLRRKAWNAAKEVGRIVHEDLMTLVRLRNDAATSLGYSNYYSMSMDLGEQSEEEIASLFDELDELTAEPFATLKQEADEKLASRFGISADEIRPWHYEDPFFQEVPKVYDVDLDRYYADRDIVDLVSRFYAGIGLDVSDIIANSDLFERQGKDQHAFCTDIDRMGDIRVLANVKPDETWTGTMLHELGHAVHDKFIDRSLPFLLRQEAHIFTTEAVAMLFGRLSKDAGWIQDTLGISPDERERIAPDLSKSLRLHQLIFARWSQVMMRFERALYLNPDQDLNALWWKLVSKHQMVALPDTVDFPHWASKTHIVSVPVYYHNYLLGELLASQFAACIGQSVLPDGQRSYTGQTSVGDYLKEKVFKSGARYRWDEMVQRSTGDALSPRYFVAEFVEARP
jgi:peptidyl-dipeptidase A